VAAGDRHELGVGQGGDHAPGEYLELGVALAREPEASKVGEATVTTPALPDKLTGALYIGGPASGPITAPPYKVFLTLAGDGVAVKLVGSVQPDPGTGQLTTTFTQNPQLPFSELVLRIKGGARAPLANPDSCGAFTTSSLLTPWSSPFTPEATPFDTFAITGCGGSQFAPSFNGGTVNQAGSFSPFTLTLSRHDRDFAPFLERFNRGTRFRSELAGDGADPFWESGSVFLTESYKGEPFGLSIVVPAKAGPFDLGNGACDCVVVRAKIEIDPHTSALTITSDPLPTILQGIPVQLKHVNVTVDRPGFTFNPTNCSQLAISAVLTSEQGATAQESVPFQVANCATLPFKPTFTVLTQGKTSKANGASLHVKVTSGPGQANIGKVKVDLPKQLPSRLTTLQKACTAAQFATDPAGCPAGSVVGTAIAHTPLLTGPLTGPVYLVSHGGAAFPDLEIVLQGEGITLILDGQTDIKKGITISTFNTVPDAPISTFDLVLPEGPHSALAAYGDLCKSRLTMPTALTGQNGAVIKQTTRIAVSGCPKHKAKKRRKTARRHKKASHKRK
jgi:hypothetical protein